jgi:hypothetical protein
VGQRLLVFQDGTEIAYVEPAFKELNRGSPMTARQLDPKRPRATMLVYFEK